MEKKLIVRIAGGLGNQLFEYANAYNMSKKLDYKLYIDDKSGFQESPPELHIAYKLNHFNLDTDIAPNRYLALKPLGYLKRKLRKKLDILKRKKSYIEEVRDKNKNTAFFPNYLSGSFSDILFVEGYFQSEKYFIDSKIDILKKFTLPKSIEKEINFDTNTIKNTNSVSISIRQNRYVYNKLKSEDFTKKTIEYVKRAANFFKQKINNPKFFLVSNDFSNLREYFNSDEFIFVNNNTNKIFTDFYSMTLCKHFIIGPTTFHWWAGYLSLYKDKICIRPPDDLNFSSNKDIYPISWKDI